MATLWRRLIITRLSRNIIYNFTGQGLLALLGLVAVKYVFRDLGQEALGIIYFTLSMNSVLVAVLDMGVSATLVREISRHIGPDPKYIRDLMRTASCLCWAAYVILVAVLFIAAPVMVALWIHLETLKPATAAQALRWLGIATLTALPRSLYSSVFRGLQRLEISNLIDVVTSLSQQCGMIVVLAKHGGLIEISIWFIVCFGLSTLVYAAVCARFLSWRALLPKYSPRIVRRNLSFSRSMLGISILSIITGQMDKLTVSKLLPIGDFGPYGFAAGTVSRVNMVTGAISQAAYPSFAAGLSNYDRVAMTSQYRKLQDFVCMLTLPLFAAVCFAEMPVFTYAFGGRTAKALLVPVAWLCLGYYMNSSLNIPYTFSIASGRPDIALRANLFALFVMCPVTVVLVQYFGLAGAGFSWVVYHLFMYAYLVPRICAECLGVRTVTWLMDFGRILALAMATYGVGWLVIALGGDYKITALLIAYGLASLGFLAGAFWLAGPELRSAAIRRK